MEASALGGDLHAMAPLWLQRLRRFLVSPTFMLMLAMVECAATALHWQIPVAVGFVVLTVLILVLSDDVFATTCPFLLLTVLVSYCHEDNPYEIFIGFVWLAIPVVAALLFHFIYYRGRYRVGYSFAGLMAVSVGTTLGGVGCLSAAEYFRPATLYYVFGLGFGMVGLYLILKAQLARRRDYDTRLLLLTALYVTAACAAFFTLHFYAERLVWMKDDLEIYGHLRLISIDNRNVFATYMLLGLPAPFYFAQKGRGWHLLGGLGILFALLLTGSRGGLLMGVALFGLCFLYLLRRDVRHRKRNLVLLVLLAVAALAAGGFLLKFYSFRFAGGFIQGDEPRVLLLKRAVEDFLGHPIFGVGLGYTGNADIYNPKTFAMNWYHMMIPQVVAGLGLVGTLGWGVLLWRRFVLMKKTPDALSRALSLCYIGLLLMSQVNPGEFCPMPYELVAVMIFLFLEHHLETEKTREEQKTEAALSALLATAATETPPALPTDVDHGAVLALAKAHMVFGVLGEGYGYLPEDTLPPETLLELQDLSVTLLRQNETLAGVRRWLLAQLREAGIPAVILKGDAVARRYPTPELRVSGDIDCLVRGEDYARAEALLLSSGYQREPEPDTRHAAFQKGKCVIELHRAVAGIPEGEMGARVEALLADTLDTAVEVPLGGETIPVPDPFHQALILLLHMQQHMREGGLGLRQMMDYALFVKKEWDAALTPRLLPVLRACGLYRFAETVTLVCVRHLGLAPNENPFAGGDAHLADRLYADFLAGGNFGKGSEAYAGSAVVTLHRKEGRGPLATALLNVKEKCNVRWPLTKKCPPLLLFFVPFWVICRLFRGDRGVSPVRMLHSAGQRGKLYDALHLFDAER